MLRRASVLLGLAVLLSLLFPVKVLLQESGVDPQSLRLPVVDLAAACVLLAALPAFAMFRDAKMAHRIPPWNGWVVLLAVFSVVFLLLHMAWPLELATRYARELAEAGSLPAALSPGALLTGVELGARLGVLASAVGVLLHLDAAPEDDAPPPVARRKK